MTRPTLVFTDLDGTLLNHDDYSWEAARPALEELQRQSIPLILVSSKTGWRCARPWATGTRSCVRTAA